MRTDEVATGNPTSGRVNMFQPPPLNWYRASGRIELKDVGVISDLTDVDLGNHRFVRVSAKERVFTRVSFKYTIFESCYLRECQFIDCDFTGAVFRDSNLRRSTFDGSKFDYCRFSSTLVPDSIANRHLPGFENIALELARSLKSNYAQVGDASAANIAISRELDSTRVHLKKAAFSRESYYRSKYKGEKRFEMILKYVGFRVLDGLWGNGESVLRLFISFLIAIGLLGVYLMVLGAGFGTAVLAATAIFFGAGTAPSIPLAGSAMVAVARYVLLGLFMAVLVKRFARR